MSFHALGLSAELLRAVAHEGYDEPTPVQQKSIPAILDGRDVIVRAQTGTGKTACFALPTLQRLRTPSADQRRRKIRALVLTPTRELACQVRDSARTYGRHLPLRSTVVYGGVGIGGQIGELRRGIDLLVATPGRLLDHVNRRTVDLSQVEILILDEADRMLDMGFLPDVRKIIGRIPESRQNLMFSASFPDPLRKLAAGIMHDPVRIDISPGTSVAERVSQVVHSVARDQKTSLLSHLIRSNEWNRVLVFTRTKRGADRLSRRLGQDGIASAAIHGDKTQSQRTRVLSDFKRSSLRVLVATDVAARGLDIDHLPHVVNYELPHVPEDYVHRVGRTGRAGNEGQAISLVCKEERALLRGIERLIAHNIPKATVSDHEPTSAGAPAESRPKPAPKRRFEGQGRNSSSPASRNGRRTRHRSRRAAG